jgi:hypothetical protein
VVITFDRPLDLASAQNAASYRVSVTRHPARVLRGHRQAARSNLPVEVLSATYDATTRQVTLVLKSKGLKSGPAELRINGAAGGVASSDGVPLNSPNKSKPGQDYQGPVNLAIPGPRGRGSHA